MELKKLKEQVTKFKAARKDDAERGDSKGGSMFMRMAQKRAADEARATRPVRREAVLSVPGGVTDVTDATGVPSVTGGGPSHEGRASAPSPRVSKEDPS